MGRCSSSFFVFYSGSFLGAWLLSILLSTSSKMEHHSESGDQGETGELSEDQTSGLVYGQNLTEYEEREKVGLVF